MGEEQYVWVKYGADCETCGAHIEGTATAQYDGRVDTDNLGTVDLFHFVKPIPQCPNGHANEYYIHKVK